MGKRGKGVLMSAFFLLLVSFAAEGDSFSQGEELFMQNKPQEALAYLEAVVAEDPLHLKAIIYLGMAYQQLRRIDDAISVYLKILPRARGETPRVAYNLGNAYFVKGDTTRALQYYSQAINADGSFSEAWLNRANTRIKTGAIADALKDYENYLALEPSSPQRPKIEEMIAFVREELAAEERRRLKAEEEARIAEEQKRKLLEEVSASLQASTEDLQGVSAGAEDVQGYDDDFVLE